MSIKRVQEAEHDFPLLLHKIYATECIHNMHSIEIRCAIIKKIKSEIEGGKLKNKRKICLKNSKEKKTFLFASYLPGPYSSPSPSPFPFLSLPRHHQEWLVRDQLPLVAALPYPRRLHKLQTRVFLQGLK